MASGMVRESGRPHQPQEIERTFQEFMTESSVDRFKIKSAIREVVPFSVQQIVDCSQPYNNK
ncbi:hypothetical protein Pmar_PMAR018591 [Perkinsus marinus ATCC 50983]|uniref:Uncharacterized protein n=1 Tax=Perkinsus marinus (strain ATCC 50983 / TXsc) TaxID=423536 RepID=C5L088_PERM5|nr:hypothetical protein Pmar_PMAR018591 [Perkinsus marinus ATCC 50983]EER09946.1 hypothetical protein Pmar_PMAR018591 [Perkinsus marinus ATCC 50983]|eukprot:XP_002778151.1 hypothetical protein Pmar_PMAR018591 [Perkinsus marinus ATCC 50983]